MSDTQPLYDANSIKILRGLEAVRIRPAMYIGDTGKRGLHHLVWEVLDNSVDEAMGGHCTHITVTLDSDGETLSVEDNGRGIPVETHPEEGRSTLEVVLTVLHAGGKFGGSGYEASGGLHGVGVSCVNALSDYLGATIRRDGGEHLAEFCRGDVTRHCERTADSRKRGTIITFHADPTIFTAGVNFDEDMLVRRFRETAFLNAGLTIKFISKKTGRKEEFCFVGGIADYVTYLTNVRTGQYPQKPFYFESKSGKTQVQVAFQYSAEDDESILTFANNINTVDGGTHLSGFKTALTRVVNTFARSSGAVKEKELNLAGDDIREGVTAVISVRLPQPQFEGQTKAKLGSVEVEGAVNSLFSEALTEYFEKNPAIVKQIVERAMIAQRARDAAKKQSELIKRKSFLGKSNRLPGKLKDCNSEDRTQTELFICEGDSASGSCEDGRDAEFQAVLPLRGKIINAEKSDLVNLLKNQEIQNLIAAIGAGVDIGEDGFNLENRRYDKIILLTDADVDGSHIATLLLTFLYRFMRPLLLGGHVYLAQPPFYKVTEGKKLTYCWTDAERDKALAKSNGKGKLIRFKGLGEMDFDELGETTLHRATRHLVRVNVPDTGDADHMLSVLMGRNVALRKEHIVAKSQDMNLGDML